jgi:hypothetical protein
MLKFTKESALQAVLETGPCPGFLWPKFFNKNSKIFFLGLREGIGIKLPQEKQTALQREHPALQNIKFLHYFVSHFPNRDLRAQLNPDLIRVKIRKTDNKLAHVPFLAKNGTVHKVSLTATDFCLLRINGKVRFYEAGGIKLATIVVVSLSMVS